MTEKKYLRSSSINNADRVNLDTCYHVERCNINIFKSISLCCVYIFQDSAVDGGWFLGALEETMVPANDMSKWSACQSTFDHPFWPSRGVLTTGYRFHSSNGSHATWKHGMLW